MPPCNWKTPFIACSPAAPVPPSPSTDTSTELGDFLLGEVDPFEWSPAELVAEAVASAAGAAAARSAPPLLVSASGSMPYRLFSRADARSQRTPPVQYMSTFFPASSRFVSSRSIHSGKSVLLRILGTTSFAPPSCQLRVRLGRYAYECGRELLKRGLSVVSTDPE